MLIAVENMMAKNKSEKSLDTSSNQISIESESENISEHSATYSKKKKKKCAKKKDDFAKQSNDNSQCHTQDESLTEENNLEICAPIASKNEILSEKQMKKKKKRKHQEITDSSDETEKQMKRKKKHIEITDSSDEAEKQMSKKKKKRKHQDITDSSDETEEQMSKKKKKKHQEIADCSDGNNDDTGTSPTKKKKKKKKHKEVLCQEESICEQSQPLPNLVDGREDQCQTAVLPKKSYQEDTEHIEESPIVNDDEDDDGAVEYVSKEAEIAALDLKVDSSLSYDVLANRSFESLRGMVSSATMAGIESFGFTTMTEVQALSIPALLEGKDLRGTAKTGSGKTLAFVIPAVELLHKLQFEPCHGTGVIVLCPTRELCMQTYSVVQIMADKHGLTHGLIIGGANRKAEATHLKKGINILVGTPGRMLDHLKNTRGFQYGNLVCLILDEADRMLSIGFEDEMKVILKIIPKRRQTMLFSATRTAKTDALTTMALKVSLVEIDVDKDKDNATVDKLTQSYLVCPTEQRFLILYTFLKRKKNKKIMVFFSSCDAVRFYHDLLNYIDMPVMCIHGKKKQGKRTETFYAFNAATSATLLCTDVAARGWDIPAVDWIVQFDPPEDPSEYIHRVGRTARGGHDGQALLMLREEELPFVRYLREKKVILNPIEVQQGKIFNIQRQLEKLMDKNYFLANHGRMAFKSYLHSYMKHKNKEFFNAHTLDQFKLAKSFGFDRPPVIDMTMNHDKRNKLYKEKRVKLYDQ